MEKKEAVKIPELVINGCYTNVEVAKMFGCSTQGGIRVSKKTKTVTIVTNLNDDTNPYNDSHIKSDGTFIYTGMGRFGDQEVTETNQNGKIGYNDTNEYTIHYFICPKPNIYIYQGVAVKNGPFYYADEADDNGVVRKVAKFPLKLIER